MALQTSQRFTVEVNLLLKGDKVSVQRHMGGRICGVMLSQFFTTAVCIQTWALSSLLHSPCHIWIIFLQNVPLSLKKAVSPPNESHNCSCDSAAGSECTASCGAAARPWHQTDARGRQNRHSMCGHLTWEGGCVTLWVPTVSLTDHAAIVGLLGLTSPSLMLVASRNSTANTYSHGGRGQWETRLIVLSCPQLAHLMWTRGISSATNNTCPSHGLPH